MSQNTELVQALKRILADTDFVMKELAQNAESTAEKVFNTKRNFQNVNESNIQDFAYYLDSTSGCVVEGLYEVREFIEEAIEQYEI